MGGDVDEDDKWDWESNVATGWADGLLKLMIDLTSTGGDGKVSLTLLLVEDVVLLVMMLVWLLFSARADHVVSQVVLQVQSVVVMTGA